MTRFADLPPPDRATLDAAAEWHLRLRKEPTLELSREYLSWIADEQNRHAIGAIESGWAAVGDLAIAPDLLALRRGALARVHKAGAKSWFPKTAAWRIVAATLVIAIAGSVAFYQFLMSDTIYHTDVGDRRVIALPDGSRISMDSDTEVRVHYSDHARVLKLDRGRARFDVAHDVTRPFTVTAGSETVVAVGTSFNVERLGSTVLVTLIQGHVVIKGGEVPQGPSAAAPMLVSKPTVSLNAGQQFVAVVDAKPVISAANLQTATAWESGHLIFKDETLGEAVDRVNRYTDRPISVDPDIASIRVSGVFNAGDVGSFVSAVTSYFPVQATTNADNAIVLQRRS
jgi:transmembrane sensor